MQVDVQIAVDDPVQQGVPDAGHIQSWVNAAVQHAEVNLLA